MLHRYYGLSEADCLDRSVPEIHELLDAAGREEAKLSAVSLSSTFIGSAAAFNGDKALDVMRERLSDLWDAATSAENPPDREPDADEIRSFLKSMQAAPSVRDL